MSGYLLRRIRALRPTLLVASMIVPGVVWLVPGDVLDRMLSEHDFSSGGHGPARRSSRPWGWMSPSMPSICYG